MKKLKFFVAALAVVTLSLAATACGDQETCEHELVTVSAVAATCENAGTLAHERCSKCGAVFVGEEQKTNEDVIVSALGHQTTAQAAVAATCESTGTLAHEACSRCGDIFVGGEKKTSADITVSALGHKFVAAGNEASDYFDAEKHYVKNVECDRADCDHAETYTTIHIGTADELMTLATDINENKDLGCYTIEFTANIDLSGKNWTPMYICSGNYVGKSFTFNGNGHSILNLTTAENLSADGGFIGKIESLGENSLVEFKNMTIENASVSVDPNEEVGAAAFLGYSDLSSPIKFTNCRVLNGTIEGGNWAGGLYGAASGSGVNVMIDVENCAVEGCTITSNSVGSAIGHVGQSASTVTIKNSSFKNNVLTSDDGKKNKAGYIFGTNGQAATTIEGCTVENVTATSDGATVDRIYGRLSFSDGLGSLTVDGTDVTQEYDGNGTAVSKA